MEVKRSYDNILHLPNSKMSDGGSYCTEEQAKMVCEKKVYEQDIIIVQEKLDGSNVAVTKIDNNLICLTKNGSNAKKSLSKEHQLFYWWVKQNYSRFNEILNEGEKICGEWLVQAHGTKYSLNHEPFVVIDLMVNNKRLLFKDVFNRLNGKFVLPSIISIGEPISINKALKKLGKYGLHNAKEEAEGIIWRLEREGQVKFICKYVKHNKEKEKYLSQNKEEIVWNKKNFDLLEETKDLNFKEKTEPVEVQKR